MKTKTVYIEVPVSEQLFSKRYDVIMKTDDSDMCFVEKKDDQIVMDVESFKKAIMDAYYGGLNGFINEYEDDTLTIKKEGGGAEAYYNRIFIK